MKLITNYYVCKLYETEIDKGAVFNCFYQNDSKIIYVIDENEKLIGVITIKVFLNCIYNGNTDYVNIRCSVLHDKDQSLLMEEANDLIKRFNITTAIPVVDWQNRLLYEISCDFEDEKENDILYQFQNKFKKYLCSYYLKDSTDIMRKVLSEQKIIVIGDSKTFDHIFRDVFLNNKKIVFMEDDIKDGYQLLTRHSALLVDLTTEKHKARVEIYATCNNGYEWKRFWEKILLQVEQNNAHMLYYMLQDKDIYFKDFLDKINGSIYIHTNNILAPWLIKNLQRYVNVDIKKGLFRDEFIKLLINLNGQREEVISRNILDWQTPYKMIQLSELYFKYKEKVEILNFVCDEPLLFTDGEKKRIQSSIEATQYLTDLENGRGGRKNSIFDISQKTSTYLKQIFDVGVQQRRSFENDVELYVDCEEKLVTIENGIRSTCGNPTEYMATIYVLGACTIFGTFVEDRYTIPSLLQEKINLLEKRYRVINLGNTITTDYERLMKKLKLCSQDILVILYPTITEKIKRNIPCIEIGNKINKLRKQQYPGRDIFLDSAGHVSDFGNILYAECIWDELQKYLIDGKAVYKNNIYDLFRTDYSDLDTLYDFGEYQKELENIKSNIPKSAKKIGSIVMNCNPFTKGHRYLIETALKQVDYIVVFVVEEDSSTFSFNDRFEMVRRGTEDIKNIEVIRSGKTVLSKATFAEYFSKSSKDFQNKKISTTYDLAVFARYIAPVLNIKYRFVGTEPVDNVTNQYNRDMKKVLSPFGINVVEIQRKVMDDGEVISASTVRELLKIGDCDQLEQLLPSTTLDYLKQKLFKLH